MSSIRVSIVTFCVVSMLMNSSIVHASGIDDLKEFFVNTFLDPSSEKECNAEYIDDVKSQFGLFALKKGCQMWFSASKQYGRCVAINAKNVSSQVGYAMLMKFCECTNEKDRCKDKKSRCNLDNLKHIDNMESLLFLYSKCQ
jgi:hypothetical protein